MIHDIWYVKIKPDSEPQKIVLFFESKLLKSITYNKAVKEKNAQLLFGIQVPKQIASCWQ